MPAHPQVKKGVLVYENDVVAYFPSVSCEKDRWDGFQDWLRQEIKPLLDQPEAEEQPADDSGIPF